MRPTEFARRADAVIAEAASESTVEDTAELPVLRGERSVARVLVRLVVSLALLTVLGSAACALLAWAGIWSPVVALPVLIVLAGASVRVSGVVPARALPVWASAALVVLACAATVWAGATHSEEVLPRRDPGSYLQSALTLAQQHRTPIDVPASTIGGAGVLTVPGVKLGSPAFYQVGSATAPSVQPQFLMGPATWYSVGYWLGGIVGAQWVPAVFGGLAVLAVGLLGAVVIGPRWSPLAALATALCFPLLHIDRATYSEAPSLFVLVTGLLVLAAATHAGSRGRWRHARTLGLLAGLLVSGGGLIRVDALRETVLLLPVAALLVIRRDGAGASLLWGAAVGTLVSAVAALGLSYRYLGDIAGSLVPLVALGVVLAGLTAVVVRLARRGVRIPPALRSRLPELAAGCTVLLGVALASRPLWQTVHQSAADPGSHVVAGLQAAQGLAVDGGRTYAEQTLAWTSWWLGPAAVVIAWVVLALAARRLATVWVTGRPLPAWTGPFLVALASSVLTWARPGITPDHPWADRRLFIILPTVILCVVAAAAWLTRWSTRRLPAAALVAASVGTAGLLLVPEALATAPHAFEHVEQGETAAVRQVCEAFAPGDVAMMVDDRAANEWPQVLRGMCDVPALSLTATVLRDDAARAASVAAVARAVQARGGRLVLLAASSDAALREPATAALVKGRERQVLDRVVDEDARLLERRPDHLVALPLQVWLAPVG